MSGTIEVRSGEELPIDRLELFLRRELREYPELEPLHIRQYASGHSNLTYELQSGGWSAVLRKPPLGPVAPKAHDMEREFNVLKSVHSFYAPAPKPYLYCGDIDVIGSPFLLMERKQGVVLDTAFPEGVSVDPEVCGRISELMADALASLHAIPYKETGLLGFSKPDGFMQRQVEGWIGRYERAKTEEIEGVAALQAWLMSRIPAVSDTAFIHYDFKLNNACFTPEFDRMTGLFDWEMSTVGDPLADLGAAMSYWVQGDDPERLRFGLGTPSITVHEGFWSRSRFMESYAKRTGRDLSNMPFYLTFAYFKLAVICQQIYYRWKKGQTADARFSQFDRFVKHLIEISREHADQSTAY